MKKVFTLIFAIIFVSGLFAQTKTVIFTENFKDAADNSNLEGYNSWALVGGDDATSKSPVISHQTLEYTGYPSSGVGNIVALDAVDDYSVTTYIRSSAKETIAWDEDVLKLDNAGEKVYAAFLVKIPEANKSSTQFRDFFNLYFKGTATGAATPRGRVHVKTNASGEVVFGVSKNVTSNSQVADSKVKLEVGNDTHLIVLVYEVIEGAKNDSVRLYINPDLSLPESEQIRKITATNSTDMGNNDYFVGAPIGLCFRQRETTAQIGGIRVAKSWEAAVLGKMPAPTNAESSDISANAFTVSWNPAEGASAYEVKLMKGETVVNTETVTSESKSFTGLDAVTEYTCEIKAIDTNTENKCIDSDAIQVIATTLSNGTGTLLHEIKSSDIFYLLNNTIYTTQEGVVGIYNLQGTKVLQKEIINKYELNLESGIYIVRLTTASGNIYSEKIKL